MEEVHTLSPAQLDSEKRFLAQITFGQNWYLTFSLQVTTCSTTCCRSCKLLCLFYFVFKGRNRPSKFLMQRSGACQVCAHVPTCLSVHLEIIRGNIPWGGNSRGLFGDPAEVQLCQCHRDGADLYQSGGREPLSTQSSRDGTKSAWGFPPVLLCCSRSLPWITSPSSSSRTWMWQLLRLCMSGKGEQLCGGAVLTENTPNGAQVRMDPFPQCPFPHETWQKSTTEAAGFAANLLPFTWACVSSVKCLLSALLCPSFLVLLSLPHQREEEM